MSQSDLQELERLVQDVTMNEEDEGLEDRRRTNLDENLFQNLSLFLSTLPIASTSNSASSTSTFTETKPSHPNAASTTTTQNLINLFGQYASPRELLVVAGETLERAKGDVGGCFLDDEDGDADEESGGLRKSDRVVQGVELGDEEHKEEEDEEESTDNLDRIVSRVTTVLDILSAALPRYNPRQNAMNQIYPLLDALDSFTVEFNQASPTPQIIRLYLEGLGRFFVSTRAWLEGRDTEQLLINEGSNRMRECLARVFVLGHERLGMKALERWFVEGEEGGKLVVSRRRDEAVKSWQAGEGVWKGAVEIVETALRSLGCDEESLLTNMTINPSGFLPYASLILLTSPSRVSGTRALLDKVEDKEELLRATMPVLGSAVQGLAGEAAWVWIGMVVDGLGGMDEMMVDILLEWLMPVMANDPSDLNRFALHRLAYRLIRSVGTDESVVELFDKLISPSNPFEKIRLSGMALLREHVRFISSDASNRTSPELFLGQLQSLVFPYALVIPSDATKGLKEVMGSIYLAWIVEVLALIVSLRGLVDRVKGDVESTKAQVDRLLGDAKGLLETLEREFRETASSSGLDQGEKMDVEMALFSLQDGLRRANEVRGFEEL